MRRVVLVVLVTTGCGDNHRPLVSDDAGASSTSDAAPDAAMMIDCPVRTQPPGEPESPIPLEATRFSSVIITTQADADALAGIRFIIDNLSVVTAPGVSEIVLPDVEVIGGGVAGHGAKAVLPHLQTVGHFVSAESTLVAPRLVSVGTWLGADAKVDLTCLKTVGGDASFTNQAGAELSLPNLATIGPGLNPSLEIAGVAATRILLPQLTTASLRVIDAPNLTTIDAPQFVGGAVYEIEIRNAPNLTSLTTGALTEMSRVSLQNVLLPNMDFLAGATSVDNLELSQVAALRSITGVSAARIFANMIIQDAPLLTDLSPLANKVPGASLVVSRTGATALTMPGVKSLVGDFSIVSNPNLSTLSLPDFTESRTPRPTYITGNTSLPNCQATAIRDHVTTFPGYPMIVAGNAPDSCQ